MNQYSVVTKQIKTKQK